MYRRRIFLSLFLAASISSTALGQCVKGSAKPTEFDQEKYFESFPYDKQIVSADDQELLKDIYGDLPGGMAEFARVIVFGRHGRVFRDALEQEVLTDRDWYKPNSKFSNAVLNATERENLDIIRRIEAEGHPRVMPGDLRFWQDKDVPPSQPWQSTVFQLHIMRSEIEAIHGKRFDDEPWLQKYFEDRYWYQPAAHYDPKSLNAHERANMKLFAMAESKKAGNKLVPGALLAFGEKPITAALLENLNLYQLRILRNEIYAIRGADFNVPWLQEHFNEQEWYSPLPAGKRPVLTALDQKNIAVILKRENQVHAALSTAKLKGSDLAGMMSDEAAKLRNEILARRGKVFKDKWLQSYFSSMPWYKPNPVFVTSMLSPTEQANVQTIARYEKSAIARERMTEG